MNLRLWMRWTRPLALATALVIGWGTAAGAAEPSSYENTTDALTQRLVRTLPPEKVLKLQPRDVLALLTPEEREFYSTGHVKFRINVPSIVTVFREATPDNEPFWLADRGFKATGKTVRAGDHRYQAWARRFDAGEVSLGINSFTNKTYPYFVAVKPARRGDTVEVTRLSPSRMKLATLENGAHPIVDREIHLEGLPPELEGQVLIRTSRSHARGAALLERFLQTKYPASESPDHVVLTWSDDPRTTMTIQWRTASGVADGKVRYREKGSTAVHEVQARTAPLSTPTIVNDPLVHLHAVNLTGLKPGTSYEYGVGAGERFTDWVEFATAPAEPVSFSFTYMGDAQVGLDQWGGLLHEAFHKFPQSAFYILAGDLVDRGHDRDDWDSFFHNAQGVFDRRVFVPVLGNHEVIGGKPPTLYLSFFQLPRHGPTSIDPERAYAFEYGNALFIVLDSNSDPAMQSQWLDKQLGASKAKWKFVSFHHPIYASHPDRNHEHLLNAWGPILDRHQVDMVLQGHDHAYLRTHPMFDGKPIQPTATKRGTYYVVSVSGTKFYEQGDRDYTAVGFENTATYQVIRVEVGQDKLHYRAFDSDGKVRDELVIDKSGKSQ